MNFTIFSSLIRTLVTDIFFRLKENTHIPSFYRYFFILLVHIIFFFNENQVYSYFNLNKTEKNIFRAKEKTSEKYLGLYRVIEREPIKNNLGFNQDINPNYNRDLNLNYNGDIGLESDSETAVVVIDVQVSQFLSRFNPGKCLDYNSTSSFVYKPDFCLNDNPDFKNDPGFLLVFQNSPSIVFLFDS